MWNSSGQYCAGISMNAINECDLSYLVYVSNCKWVVMKYKTLCRTLNSPYMVEHC